MTTSVLTCSHGTRRVEKVKQSRGQWKGQGHKLHKSTKLSHDQDYFSQASAAWDSLWTLLHKDDWKLETGTDSVKGCVKSRHEKGVGKMFMLQCIIKQEAEKLWEEITHGFNDSPQWNPAIVHCRTLKELSPSSCITYSVAAEGAGGIVSSRDFVNVRKWGQRGEYHLSAGMSITYPDMPAQKNYVRGENGAGGWAIKALPEDRYNQSELIWILRTDIKGWIPQTITDKTMTRVLLDFLDNLKKHLGTSEQMEHANET